MGVSLAMLLSIAHVVTRTVDRTYTVWTSGTSTVCVVQLSNWVMWLTPNIYFNCFFWFRVILVQCLPCILVTIFNGYLILALRKAHKVQSGLLSKNASVRRTNRTTFMLIILNIVFLLVEVPLSILIMLHAISSSFYEFLNYDIANLLVLIFNFLIVISYPINFGIYCSLSSQFLAAFKTLMYNTKLYKLCSRFCVNRSNSFRKQYKRCNSHTQNTTI